MVKKNATGKFSSQEIKLLLILALVQFTNIVDFMILMPLGPQLMRWFSITTQQFGLLVSSYTFSAAMFGLLSSFFLDRFDRKRALLTIYMGFIVGTLACAVAPSYTLLLIARIVAGAFGGVLGALGLSIVGDQIPENRRGAATGILMSAFSMASILGVPLGLGLAALSTWHLPFLVLGFSSLVIAGGVVFFSAWHAWAFESASGIEPH
jgi:predicted MFS family arabinose efflux permease